MAKNAREHLQTLHENERTHHIKSGGFDLRIGTGLAQLGDIFEQLESEKPGSDGAREAHAAGKEIFRKLATHFQEHAQHHKTMAENHTASMEACEKSVDTEDLNKLAPTQISAVIDPGRAPAGLRAVTRHGQRELPADGMPKVDTQFEHLVKVDE